MSNRVSYLFIARDAFTRIAGRVANATRALGRAVGRATASMRQSLNNAGKKFIQFGKFAVLAAAGAAVKFGSDFQDAMAGVSAITGAAGKDLQFFSDEALRLAKSSITAQTEVAKAFEDVASAKSELLADPKALSNVVEQILLLKNGGIDMATAVKVTTESLNQFGAAANQTARFVNVLAAGAKVGASKVSETGQAVVGSAVFAKKAGLSFEQLNSTIQVLAKNGIKASEAGTALKGMFIKLESQSSKKLKPSVVGLDAALNNLSKLNLNTAESMQLFGETSAAAADILISKRRLVKQWTKEITGTNSATEQAEKRNATFSKKLSKLGIIIKGVLITLFLKLEPTITKMTEKMGEFFNSITEEDIDKFVKGFERLVRELKPLAKVITGIAEGFKDVGTFIGESIAKFEEFDRKATKATISIIPEGIRETLFGKAKPPIVIPKRPVIPKPTLTKESAILFAKERERAGVSLAPGPALGPIEGSNSQTDININLRAPTGTVESIKSQSRGGGKNLNVGVNMVPAT